MSLSLKELEGIPLVVRANIPLHIAEEFDEGISGEIESVLKASGECIHYLLRDINFPFVVSDILAFELQLKKMCLGIIHPL